MRGNGLRRAILGVAAVVFLSKLLGFLREIVIARQFGTSAEYDLYLIAVMLPALAYGVLNYASFYLFVPYLTRKLEGIDTGDRRAAFRHIWPTVNLTVMVAVAVMAAIVVFAPIVMRIWADGYSAIEFARIVFFARVTAVIVLLGTTEAFLRAFLNASRIFTYPAGGAIVFNLVSILTILIFSGRFSVGAIAAGLIGGLLLQNIYLLARWVRIRPFSSFPMQFINEDSRYILSTGLILVLIELVNRSYFLIDRYFALPFGAGVISALNYSQVLVQLPDAIIGFAIGTVVFPLFSSLENGNNPERFALTYRRAVIGALFVALPLAVVFFVSARDILFLVYQRGHFDAQSLEITTGVLRPYAFTIAALFVVTMSIRACYSRGWGKIVFAFAVVVFAVKAAGTAVLSAWFSYPGISAATTSAHIVFAALLLGIVVRKTAPLRSSSFRRELFSLIGAAVGAGVISGALAFWFIDSWSGMTHIDALGRIVVLGIVTFATFAVASQLLGLRRIVRESILGLRRQT